MEPERPDPEQLLRQVKEEHKTRGKLKIFFGACAGAGKTFAMLSAAQEKHHEKEDVVIGIVETHGRQETAKLLSGLPRIPMREIIYQGITIKELDIDAAIVREPEILLVDELAHTNAIGSRHPKTWQDVQELLENGMDVYTTLNVQHLESLNDLVANLTGIRVKETVPDSIFDNADEIVLVDIPSEIILERLNEGKVYLGEFAKQRAAQHFFKIENLIALREIALRRTAERVDALRDVYNKYQTKKHSISDKILVCIGPGTLSTKLVRTAKQVATKLKSPWSALYIENDQHYKLAKEEQDLVKKSLQLAEQLGAKTETVQETHTATAIINYAKKHGITKIIVGKTSQQRWKRWFVKSLAHDIIEQSGNIDVYIINEDTPGPKLKQESTTPAHWLTIVNTLIIVAICTAVGLPAREWLEPENVVMIYLAGVVIISASSEQRASILASLLSVICYNFFFIEPYYNFYSYHIRDLVTLSVLLLTGIVISTQTSRLRQQNLFAKQREKYTSDLYALSRKLVETPGKHKIAKVVSHHIGEIFDCAATIWLTDHDGNLEHASHPTAIPDLKEESVAQWAFKHNQIAGLGTNTMPSARGYYIPLSTMEHCFGVLGIIPKETDKKFSSEETLLLKSLAIQTASALQRAKTVDATMKTKLPDPLAED
jgi:two-component system sensor histidine kinase KdpD